VRNRFCKWCIRPVSKARRAPAPLDSWVRRTPSLTARLRARCGSGFRVRVLDEGWRRPGLDEAQRLAIAPGHLAWVREVLLLCHGRPQIFARSVIPAASLTGRNRALRVLGNRPLGELLFAGRGTRRSANEVARLEAGDWLTRRLTHSLPGQAAADGIWARRVVHHLRGRPLLVAEVFIPGIADPDHDY